MDPPARAIGKTPARRAADRVRAARARPRTASCAGPPRPTGSPTSAWARRADRRARVRRPDHPRRRGLPGARRPRPPTNSPRYAGSWPASCPRRTTDAALAGAAVLGSERTPRRSTFFDLARRPRPNRRETAPDASPETPPGCWTRCCSCPTGHSRTVTTARTTRCARRSAVTGDVDQLVADVVEALVSDARAGPSAWPTAAAKADWAGSGWIRRCGRSTDGARDPAARAAARGARRLLASGWTPGSPRWPPRGWPRCAERGRGRRAVRRLRLGRDLRPARAPGGGRAARQDDVATVSPLDGYVHAPSLHHAATAAVLRSGFLGHAGDRRSRST